MSPVKIPLLQKFLPDSPKSEKIAKRIAAIDRELEELEPRKAAAQAERKTAILDGTAEEKRTTRQLVKELDDDEEDLRTQREALVEELQKAQGEELEEARRTMQRKAAARYDELRDATRRALADYTTHADALVATLRELKEIEVEGRQMRAQAKQEGWAELLDGDSRELPGYDRHHGQLHRVEHLQHIPRLGLGDRVVYDVHEQETSERRAAAREHAREREAAWQATQEQQRAEHRAQMEAEAKEKADAQARKDAQIQAAERARQGHRTVVSM